ncbi:DUF2238 domain-containing protein [Ferrimonas sediminicola]|uniref:DUF2238 domain-containing protein n=1 Tax=Ferrimonas sediminicola TaxID=2569538 RepID=A0A4U1BF77_9GAMM|nr:DUF2238 domain-containing protein [Ferrimonas sediminicola]TKB48665.1 DUF2238 domain-containing protein [Ferrimonas sediminicola]
MSHSLYRLAWVATFSLVLFWSAIDPKDGFTWFLEVLPALLGALILLATLKRWPLTPLAYQLVLLHSVILMVGGHYTYAEVPLFDTLAEWFDWQRNNYDKVGHLAQGFIPAILAREVFLRNRVVRPGGWTFFLSLCFCLAFSAFYELIEWWVAIGTGEGAEAFLGTQGYVWDTQSDMMWAMIGAILSQLLLGRRHDRQLRPLLS